jgi:hypothetical protein
MKNVLRKIWFPACIVCFFAIQTIGMSPLGYLGDPGHAFVSASRMQHPDTIRYKNQFIGSNSAKEDTSSFYLSELGPRLTARDTIFPPDSLKDTDPFRYKYFVALLDSATHVFIRDSLRNAGDSLDWPKLDSLYRLDSATRAKAAFDAWYNSLDKAARKNTTSSRRTRYRSTSATVY